MEPFQEGTLKPREIITIEDDIQVSEEHLSKEVSILVARQDVFYDDDIGEEGKESREFSEIIFLRKFNNWIKTVLINNYCDKLSFKHKPSVLDLCSGKGGDLPKWVKRKVGHYVAMEYQASLIDKAYQRLREMKNVMFPSIFVVHDAGDPNTLVDKVLDNRDIFKSIQRKIVFDIVSCQFSMHYLYENETKLRAFLHNISCKLEPGGFYIATTIDAEKVVTLMRTTESGKRDFCIQNRFFSIRFGQEEYSKLEDGQGAGSPYGLKFYFYLKDAIGRHRQSEERPVYVPEYLVPVDHFAKIASDEFDLELVEQKNFMEFYEENIDKNYELFERMVSNTVNDKLTEEDIKDQWEICGLYLVLAFKKRGKDPRRYRDGFGNTILSRKENVKDWK